MLKLISGKGVFLCKCFIVFRVQCVIYSYNSKQQNRRGDFE